MKGFLKIDGAAVFPEIKQLPNGLFRMPLINKAYKYLICITDTDGNDLLAVSKSIEGEWVLALSAEIHGKTFNIRNMEDVTNDLTSDDVLFIDEEED